MKYTIRTRPVDAIRFDGQNIEDLSEFLSDIGWSVDSYDPATGKPYSISVDGGATITPGKWVVRTEDGAVFTYEDSMFSALYTQVVE